MGEIVSYVVMGLLVLWIFGGATYSVYVANRNPENALRRKIERRTWHLKPTSWRYWLLTIELARTDDRDKAKRSRFTWGPLDHVDGNGPLQRTYILRPLGILNGLFRVRVVRR